MFCIWVPCSSGWSVLRSKHACWRSVLCPLATLVEGSSFFFRAGGSCHGASKCSFVGIPLQSIYIISAPHLLCTGCHLRVISVSPPRHIHAICASYLHHVASHLRNNTITSVLHPRRICAMSTTYHSITSAPHPYNINITSLSHLRHLREFVELS